MKLHIQREGETFQRQTALNLESKSFGFHLVEDLPAIKTQIEHDVLDGGISS